MVACAQRYTYFEPHEALKPYVHTYVYIQTEGLSLAANEMITLYPMDYAIMCFDPELRHFDELGQSDAYRFPIGFLGVSDRLRRFVGCAPSVLQVIFKPHGAFRLLGIPQEELAGKITNLEEVLPLRKYLVDALMEAKEDPKVQMQLVENWLLQMKRENEAMDVRASYIVHACHRVSETHGVITVRKICKELGISETGFRRLFKMMVGVPPKTFAELVKFNCIHRDLQSGSQLEWQRISYQYGFYDQNHFIKGFKRFFGSCPTAWIDKNCRDLTSAIQQGISYS